MGLQPWGCTELDTTEHAHMGREPQECQAQEYDAYLRGLDQLICGSGFKVEMW